MDKTKTKTKPFDLLRQGRVEDFLWLLDTRHNCLSLLAKRYKELDPELLYALERWLDGILHLDCCSSGTAVPERSLKYIEDSLVKIKTFQLDAMESELRKAVPKLHYVEGLMEAGLETLAHVKRQYEMTRSEVLQHIRIRKRAERRYWALAGGAAGFLADLLGLGNRPLVAASLGLGFALCTFGSIDEEPKHADPVVRQFVNRGHTFQDVQKAWSKL